MLQLSGSQPFLPMPMPHLITSKIVIALHVVIYSLLFEKWTPFQLRSLKRPYLGLNNLLTQTLSFGPNASLKIQIVYSPRLEPLL